MELTLQELPSPRGRQLVSRCNYNYTELSAQVAERYRQYLETTFYFRDARLRASFREALSSEELSRGPYLEAIPAFKRGNTPRQLFEEMELPADEGFLSAIYGDRPLYRHQEEAIRRVAEGRNVLVATGTGSGKTESFLLPILFHLFKEFTEGRLNAGVRALILYPMNALSNDQRDRLGEICQRLKEAGSSFRFTFGQYIGETPEDRWDAERNAQQHEEERKPGELIYRKEMRQTPPHILLTNYSMLEYLLLRPKDSLLFDGGNARWWTFLVLDEAHQYRGTKGMEMAMLLRRLKQRLRQGGRDLPVRCIATSATLLGGEADRVPAASFAAELFAEPFESQDVIIGEKEPIPFNGRYTLSMAEYETIARALEDEDESPTAALRSLAALRGVMPSPGEGATTVAGEILADDERVVKLRRLLAEGPVLLERVASELLQDVPSAERVPILSRLVDLLARVLDPQVEVNGGSPPALLAPRYHLFLRSLEGAFISYLPRPQLFLHRGRSPEVAWFEVALCRECGQHYLVGKLDGQRSGRFREAVRDPSHPDFGVDFLLPLHEGQGGDEPPGDEEDDSDQVAAQSEPVYHLCLVCCACWQDGLPPACEHGARAGQVMKVRRYRPDEGRDALPNCPVCDYRGEDPIREVIHGADGPNAVIATTLYGALPDDRRKILAFADGRQEAAFFAWYLDRTYEDLLHRNLILKAARRLTPHALDEGLSLTDLAHELQVIFREEGVVSPEATQVEIGRKAWEAVYREFLAPEKRLSLEGVGLGKWSVRWPPWYELPAVLLGEPWCLTTEEAWDLLFLLVNIMREARAVELLAEDPYRLTPDRVIAYPQTRFRIGRPRNQANVASWDGGSRVKLLKKMLLERGVTEVDAETLAVETLRKVWEKFKQCDRAAPGDRHRLLLSAQGDALRLNPLWWRFRAVEPESLYRCDVCGRLQPVSVLGRCGRPACPGRVHPMTTGTVEANHYRAIYQLSLPSALRVEEHTAQLSSEKARQFQREFKEGKMGVLSCSTTFELGVDLGNLDTVFLRNVPPEPFNYAQRVGRAGRRPGHVGCAVTYCRRSPHDLYHFAEPERMLSGKTNPPVFRLRNEKILLRHVTAIALGRFFRAYQGRFGQVRDFFSDLGEPRAVADVRGFLMAEKEELEAVLRQVVPEEMAEPLGLADGSWVERITGHRADGEPSRFLAAELELKSDYLKVRALEEEAGRRRDYKLAKWARDRAQHLEKEDILSFLSRKAVIPKYGFPVDVVELDTQRGRDEVELERDRGIAITEYAPTAEVVANKKVWKSYGLKVVPERPWPRKHYRRCDRHNRWLVWDFEAGEDPPEPPCCDLMTPRREFVIPWFGFITSREPPKDPKRKPEKLFSSRPFFIGLAGPERGAVEMPASQPLLRLSKACPGRMGVICEGRRGAGFYICATCGAGFGTRKVPHESPYGRECTNPPEKVMLGHEFITDVIQIQFLQGASHGTGDLLWFAYSLAYALMGAAGEVLEVPPGDLGATVGYPEGDRLPPIVLYDNVPGGAALVARLEDEDVLTKCLEAAVERVGGRCGCGPEESCYGCLRSYVNQFAHTRLRRGPVKDFLAGVIGAWRMQ